ncbi:LysR family transcriptional regulator [Peribacillus deserti]|uniref:LysR family transcriptional regulator n=1 Tax=Peribacillus deserti TaxID=673318 RepID=A0A2N5M0U0_9BACI|nr:LysR family transcriptional regulator [Peribacillus deserti]PLT27978.1 LysR family transcriptional regulator [Peribacillus deserti]
MDLKWIQTFLTAAKNENFRQTAEELFLSQPTVSVHIKLLEKDLGMVLFERSGRRVILTEEGRRFVPHAEAILWACQNGLEDLNRFKQGLSKKLTLAISPLIAASIMPAILKKYMSLHKNIEIEVQVLESKDIAGAILAGNADLGLTRLQIKHPDLMSRTLYEDKIILVGPYDGGEPENSPPLDAEEILAQEILITHNHPEYWNELVRSLEQHIHLRTMVVSEVHVTKRFIEEGLGVSFLPISTVRRELFEGRLLEIDFSIFQLPVARTYVVMKYEHSIQKHFLDFLSKFRLP